MNKSILILCRRDPTEAMRVAAGLTIYDHRLSLVFMVPVPDTPKNQEMLELLEFSDITPWSTVATDSAFPGIDTEALAKAMLDADEVFNL
jgi:hypothetical protein